MPGSSRTQGDSARDRVTQCFNRKRYKEALKVAETELARGGKPDWHLLYLAGQSCRSLGRLADARKYLEQALDAGGDESVVHYALGEALWHLDEPSAACSAYECAIRLDPDFWPAHNSLGIAYHRIGRLEDAVTEFKHVLAGYACHVAKELPNEKSGPVFPHVDTEGRIWTEKLVDAMACICRENGAERITWLKDRQPDHGTHGGLFYHTVADDDGKPSLRFLPNFVCAFRCALKNEGTYAFLLNDLAAALIDLGREEEARECLAEAIEFTPDGTDYPSPKERLARLSSTPRRERS